MKTLEELRKEWKDATPQQRKVIEEEAESIRNGTEHQCYYQDGFGNRCENKQRGNCWCSEEHKSAWQRKHYGSEQPRAKRKLTIQEMQAHLKQLALAEKRKRLIDKSGQKKLDY
jgi:hypothetical protein